MLLHKGKHRACIWKGSVVDIGFTSVHLYTLTFLLRNPSMCIRLCVQQYQYEFLGVSDLPCYPFRYLL